MSGKKDKFYLVDKIVFDADETAFVIKEKRLEHFLQPFTFKPFDSAHAKPVTGNLKSEVAVFVVEFAVYADF